MMGELEQKQIIEEICKVFSPSKTKKDIVAEVGNNLGMALPYGKGIKLIDAARKMMLEKVKMESNDFYIKESLDEYAEIKEESRELTKLAKDKGKIRDANEALRTTLIAMKDRNDLLGLSDAKININLNFQHVNFSRDEFLKSMNEIPGGISKELAPEIILNEGQVTAIEVTELESSPTTNTQESK